MIVLAPNLSQKPSFTNLRNVPETHRDERPICSARSFDFHNLTSTLSCRNFKIIFPLSVTSGLASFCSLRTSR